jgi:hypothetical protein
MSMANVVSALENMCLLCDFIILFLILLIFIHKAFCNQMNVSAG